MDTSIKIKLVNVARLRESIAKSGGLAIPESPTAWLVASQHEERERLIDTAMRLGLSGYRIQRFERCLIASAYASTGSNNEIYRRGWEGLLRHMKRDDELWRSSYADYTNIYMPVRMHGRDAVICIGVGAALTHEGLVRECPKLRILASRLSWHESSPAIRIINAYRPIPVYQFLWSPARSPVGRYMRLLRLRNRHWYHPYRRWIPLPKRVLHDD